MGRNREVITRALRLLERALLRRVEAELERTFADGWPGLTGLPEAGSERRWLLRVLREQEALLSPVVGGNRRNVEVLLGGPRWPAEPPGPETARTLSAVITLLVSLEAPEADAVLALKAGWERGEPSLPSPPGGAG